MKQIDFTATFKKLRAAFVLFNDKVKLKHPDQYRKLSLKSTHMETARELIRCYGAHLHKPKQLNIEGDKTFTVTNKGVGKNKLQHRCTIYRHILVLKDTGIIINKVFHGTGKGIEIELNQNILVYKKDIEALKSEIQAEIDKIDTKRKQNVARCDDKEAFNLLDTNNINKACGYVDKGKLGARPKVTSRIQGSPQSAVPKPKDATLEGDVSQKCTKVAGDDPIFSEIIDFYTQQAWHFARSVLYPKVELSNLQVDLAKMYVRDYFSLIPHERFKRSFVDKLLNDFYERVILAKRYVDRSPERFLPLPHIWLNRYFRNGFCGTLAWLNKVRANKLRLGNYIKNLSAFCDIYKQYLSDSCVYKYYESLRKLEALKDPKLVEYFNHCVVDRNKFDAAYLRDYYKISEDGKL